MSEPDLIDAAGTLHAPAGPEARIVSLVPSLTELLFDLGLGTQVVGRTHFCVHPDAAKPVPSVGGTKKIRLGRLEALRPTHVILNIDENTTDMAAAIAACVPHVIVTHPLGPRDNLGLYRLLGGIFGRAEQAEGLCRDFGRALDELEAAAGRWPRQRVLYLIWRDPWMTVSRDTYVSRTLALARWDTEPAIASVRYPRSISRENSSRALPWSCSAASRLPSQRPTSRRFAPSTTAPGCGSWPSTARWCRGMAVARFGASPT